MLVPLYALSGTVFFSWLDSPRGLRFSHFLCSAITLDRTPLDKLSAHRIDLYLNTLHSEETDIHVPGGIRTHSPIKRAAVDPRLRLRSHYV